MPESIVKRINAAPLSAADKRELLGLFSSILGDMQAVVAQLNILIDEASETDAEPVTLNTTE